MSRLTQQQQQHQMQPSTHSPEMNDPGLVIKLLMVNGDSRSLRIYKWYTVNVSCSGFYFKAIGLLISGVFLKDGIVHI